MYKKAVSKGQPFFWPYASPNGSACSDPEQAQALKSLSCGLGGCPGHGSVV